MERENEALPARSTRNSARRAGPTSTGYFAEYRVLRAAGGHRDGVLRGKRFFAIYQGARQIENALGRSRYRRVCVLVSQQPATARGSFVPFSRTGARFRLD